MTTEADALKPGWEAYANARGLDYYDHWSIPEATQLLHHGSFDDAPNVIIGDLPGGLRGSWLAHFVADAAGFGDPHSYTVVIVSGAASVRFAVRVLCHDRGLDRAEAANPDSERETVPSPGRARTRSSARWPPTRLRARPGACALRRFTSAGSR